MIFIIWLVGMFMLAMAVIGMISPKRIRMIMEFAKKGKHILVAGVVRIVLGTVFLLGASSCNRSIIIGLLGVITLAAGITIFILGKEKVTAIVALVQGKPDNILRSIMLIPFVIGLLVLYAV